MRIATFNVENLFMRAKAMNLDTWADGKPVLTEYSKLNAIFQKPVYTATDKKNIVENLKKLGLGSSDESKFVILRQNRGELLKRSKNKPPEVVANGRGDWIGWIELKVEQVNETATQMTARVIKDVNADIVGLVEADNRVSLIRFNEQLLKPIDAAYGGMMLIDGNDERGIDVGLLMKPGIKIEWIVSHVDDEENGLAVFSRDCAEYLVRLNATSTILVMVNHFKSKGYGSQETSNAKRELQADRVKKIYDLRRAQGIEHIAILGDFNDLPDSKPLQPLLGNGSDLKDIFEHPQFQGDGRPGTFGNGTKSSKIDYLLLSPEAFNRVTAGGINRKGVWGGTNGTLFPHYDEMTKPAHAASDHAAVWADLDL